MKTAIVFLLGLVAFVRIGSAQRAEVPVVSGQVQLADGQPVVGASLVLFDVAADALSPSTTEWDGSDRIANGFDPTLKASAGRA